jgi:hypothetical protein
MESNYRVYSIQANPWIASSLALFLLIIIFDGCSKDDPTGPKIVDEGYLIVDNSWVIDTYNYDSLACREVLASGVWDAGTIPASSIAKVQIIATACYKVRIQVEDFASRRVRTFDQQFAILNRQEGDKDRGLEGFLTWDGKDDSGLAVPRTRYLWRLEFDFGKGRLLRARADIRLD